MRGHVSPFHTTLALGSQRTRCAPLPLVGRGWGWGSEYQDRVASANSDPHPARRSASKTRVNALKARHPPHGEGRSALLALRSVARADAACANSKPPESILTLISHSPSRSRGAFLRPGFCLFASLTPRKGWRSAERRTDACEASVGPALSGQARHLARRLASPYGGRPPPGAHTVAILGAGAALPLTGIAAGSVIANSHVRVVVPGGGPLPPGATVANRRRRTPRLAPSSGSSLEHAP
jgi:hypothetical protein